MTKADTTSKDRATKVTTPSDREVVMTRDFAAPRRLVFEAWTSPMHLPHWLLGPSGWTMPVCEVDLRLALRLATVRRLRVRNARRVSGDRSP